MTTSGKKLQGNLTPEKFILNTDYPAVINIATEQGIDVVVGDIIEFAHEYISLMEFGKKMNASALVLTLKEMIIDFPDWSVEDFRYFFKGFAKGNYNEKMFRLDTAVIYDGAKCYEIERTTAREKVIANRKHELNKRDPKGVGDPDIEKEIQMLISKLSKPVKEISEDLEINAKKQKRANYEAELIDYFNQNSLEFSEENFAEYRKIKPFIE